MACAQKRLDPNANEERDYGINVSVQTYAPLRYC